MIESERSRHQGIVVVGSIHVDVIAVGPRLPVAGESILGERFSIRPGGKGGNQAARVALLGGSATMIGRTGDDHFGRILRDRLAAAGVVTDYLAIDQEEPTGASPIFVGSDGEYASIIIPGAAARLSPEDLANAREAFDGAGMVMLQLELPPSITIGAAKLARQSGAQVMLNASPLSSLPCPADLWPLVDLLIVNEIEARRLLELSGSDSSPTDLSHRLADAYGLPRVVVTLGAAGAQGFDRGASRTVGAPQVSVVDAVGAGDAFAGALCNELVSGRSLLESLPFAVAAGADAVTRPGGVDSYGPRSAIESLLAEIEPSKTRIR